MGVARIGFQECYHDSMRQVTLRLTDDLLDGVKQAAEARGQSVNAWVAAVLSAAVDPDLAGDEAEQMRSRLARAGLLAEFPPPAHRPDHGRVARARAAAGRGRPLSDLVSEDRR
jgi:hypothetical protein